MAVMLLVQLQFCNLCDAVFICAIVFYYCIGDSV